MTIAETILTQLGGRKFIAMTGAKNFLDCGSGLSMKLPKNPRGINHVKVTLNALDTYDMIFQNYMPIRVNHKTGVISGDKLTIVAQYEGVYCDQLEKIFHLATGLYTRL